MISATLELAVELIRRQSVTPEDAGCQQFMLDRLGVCGFQPEQPQAVPRMAALLRQLVRKLSSWGHAMRLSIKLMNVWISGNWINCC